MLSFPFHTQLKKKNVSPSGFPFCNIITGKDKTSPSNSPYCWVRSFQNPKFNDSVHQVLVVLCCGLENWVCSLKAVSHLDSVTWLAVCVTVPHALSALSSLQGNRCQQSCMTGFFHDKQEGTCKPCHKACATCAGESRGQGSGTVWKHP